MACVHWIEQNNCARGYFYQPPLVTGFALIESDKYYASCAIDLWIVLARNKWISIAKRDLFNAIHNGNVIISRLALMQII